MSRTQWLMMGSRVCSGGMDASKALSACGAHGTGLGDELSRIGYRGDGHTNIATPIAFLELNIEQGPVLEKEGFEKGAVENLQGISWKKVTIQGEANHAGTTPMRMRSATCAESSLTTLAITTRHEHICPWKRTLQINGLSIVPDEGE